MASPGNKWINPALYSIFEVLKSQWIPICEGRGWFQHIHNIFPSFSDSRDRDLFQPCPGSEVLTQRSILTSVSVGFVRSLRWHLVGVTKFYMRPQFFPLCVPTFIWLEKSKNLTGILFISHHYWVLLWFWHLTFNQFASYSLKFNFRKKKRIIILIFFTHYNLEMFLIFNPHSQI